MTPSGKSKANANVETMWDVYQEIVEYSVDSTKQTEYQEAVEQYSDILKPIGNNEYELIISDPVVAQKFNSNGVLAVDNNIYLAEEDKITKYEQEGETLRMVDEFDRIAEIPDEIGGGSGGGGDAPTDLVITKTGEWLSNPIAINVSSHRKVKVWLYSETYGDIGASVGAKSKYYRDNWKDHSGSNRLEFKCTKFTYTNYSGLQKNLYSECALDNTTKRVHLYAANRYVNMDGDKSFTITNPVVKFYRDSDGSGTAFVFDDFN